MEAVRHFFLGAALVLSMAIVIQGDFVYDGKLTSQIYHTMELYMRGQQSVVIDVPHLDAVFIIDPSGTPRLVTGCSSGDWDMLKVRFLPPTPSLHPTFVLYSVGQNGMLHFLVMNDGNYTLTTVSFASFDEYLVARTGVQKQLLKGSVFHVVVSYVDHCIEANVICREIIRSYAYGRDLVFRTEKSGNRDPKGKKTLRKMQLKVRSALLSSNAKSASSACSTELGPYRLTSQLPTAQNTVSSSSIIVFNMGREHLLWVIEGRKHFLNACPNLPFTNSLCDGPCENREDKCMVSRLMKSYVMKL